MYHPRTRRREREFPCHLHLLRGRFKTEAIVKRQTALLAVCMMFLVISIQAQAPQSPQVLARPMLETAEDDSRAMKRAEREYGKLNPKAPPELSRFAFLIGEWSCDAELKRGDGIWESLKATWEGRLRLVSPPHQLSMRGTSKLFPPTQQPPCEPPASKKRGEVSQKWAAKWRNFGCAGADRIPIRSTSDENPSPLS